MKDHQTTERVKGVQHSLIVIGFILAMSGFLFDIFDIYIYRIPEQLFIDLQILIKDIKFVGISLVTAASCSYKLIKTKVLSFLFCIWSLSVTIIHGFMFDKELSIFFACIFQAIYLLWFFRLLLMKNIKSEVPEIGQAFYVWQPINSFWGILQAVFLFWYPARYETRIISDGQYVWSVHHNTFQKDHITETDINFIKGVRIPLGRKLKDSERNKLNSLVGKRAIFGYRDCRKLLVLKEM